jgi:hypothetical protein
VIIFIIAALIVYAGLTGGAPLLSLAVAAGYALWYGWSVRRRPYRPCWWCHGSGWRSGIDPGNDSKHDRSPLGRCWVCRGTKTQVRWGVRWFTPSVHKQIQAGKRGRNY